MIGRVWRAMLRTAGIRTWAIIGAGMVGTALGMWRTWIVWKGPWPADRAQQQLDIIGWALWADMIINAVIVIALTGLGVAASVSKAGVSLNVGDDDNPPQATVTTTTETTVTAEPKA